MRRLRKKLVHNKVFKSCIIKKLNYSVERKNTFLLLMRKQAIRKSRKDRPYKNVTVDI